MELRLGIDSRKGNHVYCLISVENDKLFDIIKVYHTTHKKEFLKELVKVKTGYRIDKIIEEI